MDDERTVDVDEPREQQPYTDSPEAVIARLSPLQQAWEDYTGHTDGCPLCRTSGGGRCDEAGRLWQAHQDLCDEAYRRLSS
jgi:hypothetical protein